MEQKYIEKFWSKVRKGDGCWEWIESTSNGYGLLYVGEGVSKKYAHRFSWEIHNGHIPDGMWVLHQPLKAPHRKLTWDLVNAIRAAHSAGSSSKELAASFQISREQVNNIVSERHWKVSV